MKSSFHRLTFNWQLNYNWTLNSSQSQSQSHIVTDDQSVSLGVEPNQGLMTRYLLLFHSYVLVIIRHPLWEEDGSVSCICCWSLPAQSFSGLSPLGLTTIVYCLRCETSFFVASYDSQGHGGVIWPHLHTGNCRTVKSKSTVNYCWLLVI
jgi:hypothetical protein